MIIIATRLSTSIGSGTWLCTLMLFMSSCSPPNHAAQRMLFSLTFHRWGNAYSSLEICLTSQSWCNAEPKVHSLIFCSFTTSRDSASSAISPSLSQCWWSRAKLWNPRHHLWKPDVERSVGRINAVSFSLHFYTRRWCLLLLSLPSLESIKKPSFYWISPNNTEASLILSFHPRTQNCLRQQKEKKK